MAPIFVGREGSPSFGIVVPKCLFWYFNHFAEEERELVTFFKLDLAVVCLLARCVSS